MQRLLSIPLLLLTIASFFWVACSKSDPEPAQSTRAVPSEEYIRGYFGNEYINFDKVPPLSDDATHTYMYNGTNVNQINLIRSKGVYSLAGRRFEIYIMGYPLDEMPIPMVYNYQAYPYAASVSFIDGTQKVDTLFSATDKYNYSAVSCADPFQLTVISKTNDIIQGTFEGIVSTRTGLTMKVAQGEFRVKIKRRRI